MSEREPLGPGQFGGGGDAELDQRLRDLFAEPAMDLPPAPGAADRVLWRVRQASRRRLAVHVALPLVAASAVAAVMMSGALGGLFSGSPASPDPALPAGPPGPAAVIETSPPAHQTAELVMHEDSVGTLRLGMTRGEAEGTGLLEGAGAPRGECLSYDGRRGIIDVLVGSHGVEWISVYPFIETPEGIAVGDTFAELRSAYPGTVTAESRKAEAVVEVPAPAEAVYVFTLNEDGDRVDAVALRSVDATCR